VHDESRRIDGYDLIGRVSAATGRSVWQARDRELGRLVAIKEVSGAGAAKALRAEAAVLARLRHPNIVRVFALLDESGRALLVEEWVDGATLGTVRTLAGRLTLAQSVGVLRGALLGLEHAHRHDISHGDLSPANILVDRDGTPKLIDFVAPLDVRGTPGYASPEVGAGRSYGPQADVFSAAVILAELTTGLPPEGATQLRGVPDHLAKVLRRALSADPAGRQPDAGVLLAELEEASDRSFGAGWWSTASTAGLSAVVTAIVAGGTGVVLESAASTGSAGAETLVEPGGTVPSGSFEQVASLPGGPEPVNAAGDLGPAQLRPPDASTPAPDAASASSGASPVGTAPARRISRGWLAGGAAAITAAIALTIFLATTGSVDPPAAAPLPPPVTSVSSADPGPGTSPGVSPSPSSTVGARLSAIWTGEVSVVYRFEQSGDGSTNVQVHRTVYRLTGAGPDPTTASWTASVDDRTETVSDCGTSTSVTTGAGSGSGDTAVTVYFGESFTDGSGATRSGYNITTTGLPTFETRVESNTAACGGPPSNTVGTSAVRVEPGTIYVFTESDTLLALSGSGPSNVYSGSTVTYDLRRLTCAEVPDQEVARNHGCS
jgi:eukaryotic-like serine/threonine-protein kinase